MTYRSAAEFRRFFDGLELLEPGVRTVHRWRPGRSDLGAQETFSDADIPVYAGVARKL